MSEKQICLKCNPTKCSGCGIDASIYNQIFGNNKLWHPYIEEVLCPECNDEFEAHLKRKKINE